VARLFWPTLQAYVVTRTASSLLSLINPETRRETLLVHGRNGRLLLANRTDNNPIYANRLNLSTFHYYIFLKVIGPRLNCPVAQVESPMFFCVKCNRCLIFQVSSVNRSHNWTKIFALAASVVDSVSASSWRRSVCLSVRLSEIYSELFVESCRSSSTASVFGAPPPYDDAIRISSRSLTYEYWTRRDIMQRCLRDLAFIRFGTIPACDRQTDGRTDTRRQRILHNLA